MDRFGIFLNPMSGNDNKAIIQTIKPVCILNVNDSKSKGVSKTFNYKGESINLSVHFCEGEIEEERILKIIERAWHWYKSYLEWEGNR